MSVVDTAKTAYDLAMRGMTIELQGKIMQLKEEALGLQEENLRLKKENRELKERIELQETVKFYRRVYWRAGDPTPYCPLCHEKSHALMHLTEFAAQQKGMLWLCWGCGSKYLTEEEGDFTFYSGPTKR